MALLVQSLCDMWYDRQGEESALAGVTQPWGWTLKELVCRLSGLLFLLLMM